MQLWVLATACILMWIWLSSLVDWPSIKTDLVVKIRFSGISAITRSEHRFMTEIARKMLQWVASIISNIKFLRNAENAEHKTLLTLDQVMTNNLYVKTFFLAYSLNIYGQIFWIFWTIRDNCRCCIISRSAASYMGPLQHQFLINIIVTKNI